MKKILKNKKLLVILILLIVLGFVLIIYLLRGSSVKETQDQDDHTSDSTTSDSRQSTVSDTPLPTTTTRELPEVPKKIIEKIDKEAEKVPATNDYIVEETKDFAIDYYDEDKGFLIVILGSPFEEKKRDAEKTFLENLDITEEEACKLKVEITTPMYANPDEAGGVYSLSFCE
jgi:cytoskeletal protein RodZ